MRYRLSQPLFVTVVGMLGLVLWSLWTPAGRAASLHHADGSAPQRVAATFTITNAADNGTGGCTAASTGDGCTLREAMDAANNQSGDDAIVFDATAFATRQTITVTNQVLPQINDNLSIVGTDAGVIINGNNLGTVFAINLGERVAFTRLTITGGNSSLFGGGIDNSGRLVVDSCTITGNQAERGGGIYTGFLSLTLRNSTVSDNTAFRGGGVANSGDASIESSTITNNTANRAELGSGVVVENLSQGSGTTQVQNSIIAGNAFSDVDIVGTNGTRTFQSNGYNLIGSGNGASSFNQPSDQTSVTNPGLATLADNGGPTLTHAVVRGGPAYNTGNTTLLVDQRGVTRPQDGTADIGAYEGAVEPTPTATRTPTNTPTATRTNTPTATRTNTPTATRTPTNTNPATNTANPTNTNTGTPTSAVDATGTATAVTSTAPPTATAPTGTPRPSVFSQYLPLILR